MHSSGDTAVVLAAKNEEERVAATVATARLLPGVSLTVVVDDGSADGTAHRARTAGAYVVRHGRNRGKAAAMETGAEVVGVLDQHEDRALPRHLCFLDADLDDTAAAAAPLMDPVRAGVADMTIGRLPADRAAGGGHGFVVGLSRAGIRREAGWEATQPLSGQRCLTREAYEAGRPLADGFGVETALTIDLLKRGMRVREVDVAVAHRVTGSDWRGTVHRARQFIDVGRALTKRRMSSRSPAR